MKVKEIMSTDIFTVSPETGIYELAESLVKKNISGAPVVSKRGEFLGIVREEGLIFKDKKVHLPTFLSLSAGFLALGVKRYEEEIKKITASKVADIMETGCLTVASEADIDDAATLMLEKETYYLPVVDDGCLKGVLTKKDIVRAIAAGGRGSGI